MTTWHKVQSGVLLVCNSHFDTPFCFRFYKRFRFYKGKNRV